MVAIVVFSAMEVVEMDSTDIAQEIEVPPCKKTKRASRRNTAKAASKVRKKKKETGKLLTKAERVKVAAINEEKLMDFVLSKVASELLEDLFPERAVLWDYLKRNNKLTLIVYYSLKQYLHLYSSCCDATKGAVKDLEKEITCAICHEHYQEPKVLPCCHYYCKQCVYQLALRRGLDQPFPCPECRRDVSLPAGGLDQLPTAFFVNRMKEVHSKLGLAHGRVEAKCELCLEDKAEAFCRQCAKFLCAECVKSHQRMKKAFPGHKVSTLEELREGKVEDIVLQQPSFTSCPGHDQPMNMYCYDCKCLICPHCTIKDHAGHKFEFLKKAVPEMKKQLGQQLNPLRDSTADQSGAVKTIKSTVSDLRDQAKSSAEKVERSFEEYQQILDQRKQQLLAEIHAELERKTTQLSLQEKSLSMACAGVQSVIDYIEHFMEHSSDAEIACMHAEMQSRIATELQRQQEEGKALEPVEEADLAVEVSCAQELKQLCQTKAILTRLPIQASVELSNTTEVGKMSQTNFSIGKPTKRQACRVECHLKSLATKATTKCQVEHIHGNEYCIQYTPTIRGRHELIVNVNGQEVAGSPFPVLVSIHPTQLSFRP